MAITLEATARVKALDRFDWGASPGPKVVHMHRESLSASGPITGIQGIDCELVYISRERKS